MIIAAVVLSLLALLKLVSWWDSKQGVIDPNAVQTTVPAANEKTEVPSISDPEPPEGEETPADSELSDQPAGTAYVSRTEQLIAEVYALRDQYIAELETMYAEAEAELTELAKQEGDAETIAAVASSYLTKASEMEAKCDGQIDAIVAELETQIRDNNGDLTVIDTLIETYATEKATKKAWYIERLEEKGLIS